MRRQLMVGTESVLRYALQEGVKITLVVNKIDRLILELRIKPADAYYKIKHTIEEINTFIRLAIVTVPVSSYSQRLTDAQRYRPRP
jgi:translation elongation factor EF-G